jgi:hypothetical protein
LINHIATSLHETFSLVTNQSKAFIEDSIVFDSISQA